MKLDPDFCYQALLSRDPRFDGVFFVGVSSTRIYCRPVCRVRNPMRENCTFYPSAAAAEQAGYRPCLRCRPELAPGNAHIDSPSRLAALAASRIEDGALEEKSLSDLAAELQITERHLRRVIRAEYGVSPIELAQSYRLLMAKRLLTDTDLPVIDVAFASGFSSLRRFNALFKERYRLNPTGLRKTRESSQEPFDGLAFEIAYQPPFDWDALLTYLDERATAGVEAVSSQRYLRTARLKGRCGWIVVEPSAERNTLQVKISNSLAPVLVPVQAKLKRVFDLTVDPAAIAVSLGPLVINPGLRLPGAFDGFELSLRAILGQQTSVRSATTLMSRLVNRFGEPYETPFEQLHLLCPTPETVAQASPQELASIGMPVKRGVALQALAQAVASGRILLEPGKDFEDTIQKLEELPGIGPWTAQYIAMRALGWPDAFPHSDLGIKKALGLQNPTQILAAAEAWRPWRAYAALHLWDSLRR